MEEGACSPYRSARLASVSSLISRESEAPGSGGDSGGPSPFDSFSSHWSEFSASCTQLQASEEALPDEELVEEVKRFVRETGGGAGVWCGNGRVFGLGVRKLDAMSVRSRRVRDCEAEEGEGAAGAASSEVQAVLPHGFGEGREILKPPQPNKKKMKFEEFIRGPPKAIAFGRVSWDQQREPVNFVRITSQGNSMAVSQLLRFFAENVWGLVRPRLLISVFGSSLEMDLKLEHQKKLSAIMHVAMEAKAFVVTNGLDSGVSKFVADARKEVENAVPVIGVAPWGLAEGRQALWENEADGRLMSHNEKLPVEDFKAAEHAFNQMKPGQVTSARLSQDHSHLILVDDGSIGTFGAEAEIRASFEQALCSPDLTMQNRIKSSLKREGYGWQLMSMKGGDADDEEECKPISSVSLCVQGGEASILRVYETIKNDTPVLLARGTGRAADLMSDALLLYRRRTHFADDFSRAGTASSAGTTRRSDGPTMDDQFKALDDDKSQDGIFERLEEDVDENRNLIVSGILDRVNDENDSGLMATIGKTYHIKKFRDFHELARKIQEIAKSRLVQIMDMDRQEDMGGAMLLAILRKERQDGMDWKDCLQLIVVWNHAEIMKRTLARLQEDAALISVGTRRAVEGAFHLAVKANKVCMIFCILEYWDCTETAYNIKNTGGCEMRFWSTALLSIKERDRRVKKSVKQWARIVARVLREWNTSEGLLAYQRWSDLYDTSMADDEVRKLMERARAGSGLEGVSLKRMLKKDKGVGQRQKENMQVKDLERLYKFILGENFWYETSALGCEMDLFLWSLLMRRKAMVKMLWARMAVPVRSLLLASTMYRNWVAIMDLKAHFREALLEDAAEYEQMAVDVQMLLMRADSNIAQETLERPSRLWKGQTGVDLAVLGNNTVFIEKCCGEAFDCRWTGDIHAYDQRLGLYPTVLVCILSFGLLAPDLIVFRPPPRSEALRAPSQRIKIPKMNVDSGSKESYVDKTKLKEQRLLAMKLQKMNHATGCVDVDAEMLDDEILSAENFSAQVPRSELMYLFFNAPVTLFMVDAMQQVFYNVVFTNFVLVQHEHQNRLTWAECILSCSVLSTSISELMQLILDGAGEYFSSSWNWFRVLACGLFWMGLYCKKRSVDDMDLSDERYYAAALFFMWMQVLHLLSVHKALGPLVIAFSRMRDDVMMFGTIWTVLLLAFSCAMQGSGGMLSSSSSSSSEVAPPPVEVGGNPMQQWHSWWLVRTYFQSFGEPFFEELTTDHANWVTIVMWPVMNLMLVNLLIAIMNDTYMEVKDQSRLQWMIQMYYIAKEYRSPSRLNVIMLIADVVNFLRNIDEVDRRTKKLLAKQSTDFSTRGYLEGLRFKFRKFQSRDMPAFEKAEIQRELQKRIQELEEREGQGTGRRGSLTFGTAGDLRALSKHLQQAGWKSVSFTKEKKKDKSKKSKKGALHNLGGSMKNLGGSLLGGGFSFMGVRNESGIGSSFSSITGTVRNSFASFKEDFSSRTASSSAASASGLSSAAGVSATGEGICTKEPTGPWWRRWFGSSAPARGAGGRVLTLAEVKSKLYGKLLKLKVQQKQDQEALRNSEKHLLQAKNDFLKAHADQFIFNGSNVSGAEI